MYTSYTIIILEAFSSYTQKVLGDSLTAVFSLDFSSSGKFAVNGYS